MKDEGPLFRLCHDQQALRAVTVGVPWPRALLPAPGPHLLQPLLGLQDVPLHLVSVGLHAGDEQGQLLGGSPVGWGGAAPSDEVLLFPPGSSTHQVGSLASSEPCPVQPGSLPWRERSKTWRALVPR